MSRKRRELSSRTAEIHREIARIDLICSGSLIERTKVCGKPNCRCATEPDARHGPYFEWKRRENNRLRHRIVSTDEARRIRQAQDDYRRILGLLADWEDESLMVILGADRLKHRKHGK